MKTTTSIEPYIRKKILASVIALESVETTINKTEYFLYYAFMTNWLSWVMASATSGFYKTQKVTFFWDKTWVLCAAYVISSIIGIFMPDIDNPKRLLGAVTKGAPSLFHRERSYTHSLGHVIIFFGVVTGGLLILNSKEKIQPIIWLAYIGFVIGYMEHLFLDVFTKVGIPVFWSKKKFQKRDCQYIGDNIHITYDDDNFYIRIPLFETCSIGLRIFTALILFVPVSYILHRLILIFIQHLFLI